MELSLVRSLMDKEFYDEHRGAKCPDRLFSKDVRKIKQAIDKAMENYNRSVTPDEIEALFISSNPTFTTAQKGAYSSLFNTNLVYQSILVHVSDIFVWMGNHMPCLLRFRLATGSFCW